MIPYQEHKIYSYNVIQRKFISYKVLFTKKIYDMKSFYKMIKDGQEISIKKLFIIQN